MVSKILPKFILSLFTLVFFMVLLSNRNAYAIPIDLRQFIAPVSCVDNSSCDHSLSTGEAIHFTGQGGSGSGTPVRQYKNSNYEQFFVGGGGIYRREDTSWAPNNADAICADGHRAGLAWDRQINPCFDYSDGDSLRTDGTRWSIGNVDYDGVNNVNLQQQAHQIVPYDLGITDYSTPNIGSTSDVKYCTLSQPAGVYDSLESQACPQNPTLVLTGYFDAGEYTFCSGVTNPKPLVTIGNTTGAGQGDGFAYMQDCGLVGFRDAFREVGLISGCGLTQEANPSIVEANCVAGGSTSGNTGDVPVLFSGKIRTTEETFNSEGRSVSGAPLEGVTVALYEGTWDFDSGNRKGMVDLLDSGGYPGHVFTDENGNYEILGRRKAFGGSFDNSIYMFVWCGQNVLADAWKLDLTETEVRHDMFPPCRSRDYSGNKHIPSDSVDLSILGAPLACGNQIPEDVVEDVKYQFTGNYDGVIYGQSEIGPGATKPIKLFEADYDKSFRGDLKNPQVYIRERDPGYNLPNRIMPIGEPFPGRANISQINYDVSAAPVGWFGGTRDLADPWREGDDLSSTLPLCEAYFACDEIVSSTQIRGATRNTNTCYHFVANLTDVGLWEDLYNAVAPQNPPVCIGSEGEIDNLCDFEPTFDTEFSCGSDYKYKIEDGYDFPYVALTGDPNIGINDIGQDEPTIDSPRPDDELNAVSRYRRLDNQTEPSQKTQPTAEIPPGPTPHYSEGARDLITNSIASGDITGESKPLAGVLSQPKEEDFGIDYDTGVLAADLQPENHRDLNFVGRGDYQIGRPDQLCTRSYKDTEYEAATSLITCSTSGEFGELHLWCGGYDYVNAADADKLNSNNFTILDVACEAADWPVVGGFFAALIGFFGGECIDEDVYEWIGAGTDIAWIQYQDPVIETFPSGIGGACAPWKVVNEICNDGADPPTLKPTDPGYNEYINAPPEPNTCRVTRTQAPDQCRESCGGSFCTVPAGCDGATPECPECPVCGWCPGPVTITYERPQYVCNGDLYANFSAQYLNYDNVAVHSTSAGIASEFSLQFATPREERRACSSLTLTNYEVTSQENINDATRAFNYGNPGVPCIEQNHGYGLMPFTDVVSY